MRKVIAIAGVILVALCALSAVVVFAYKTANNKVHFPIGLFTIVFVTVSAKFFIEWALEQL